MVDDEAPVHRVVIVPGFAAGPANHWFPWLATTLSRQGVNATVLDLPDPTHPQRSAWETTLAQGLGEVDPGTWIIAHSLGCITTLRVLNQLAEPWRLGGLVLVAGFSGRLDHNPVLDDYLAEPAPTAAIAEQVDHRWIIASDDDPSVPLDRSLSLAEQLDAEPIVLPGRGHFRARDGVVEFPELLDLLTSAR